MDEKIKYGKALRVGLLVVEPIRRAGLRTVFEEMHGIELYEGNLDGLLSLEALDIILISLMVPEELVAVVERIKLVQSSARILIMSPESDQESILAAMFAGARGYLRETASPEEVSQAVEVVASGSIWAPRAILSELVDRMLPGSAKPAPPTKPQFTQRELEVLQLLVSARSNREIAQALGIEVRTVKSYVGRMMRKVGVGNRIALSIHAATHMLSGSGNDA